MKYKNYNQQYKIIDKNVKKGNKKISKKIILLNNNKDISTIKKIKYSILKGNYKINKNY
jgi:hypothetical protein